MWGRVDTWMCRAWTTGCCRLTLHFWNALSLVALSCVNQTRIPSQITPPLNFPLSYLAALTPHANFLAKIGLFYVSEPLPQPSTTPKNPWNGHALS